MPTVAESKHPEQDERRKQAVQEFVEATRLSVNDSVHVLRARLYGLGLRGQELNTEVRFAENIKLERCRVHTVSIFKPGSFPELWAVGNLGSLTWEETRERAGKFTIQEAATIRDQVKARDWRIVVEIGS